MFMKYKKSQISLMSYYDYMEINTKYSSAIQSTHDLFVFRNFVK